MKRISFLVGVVIFLLYSLTSQAQMNLRGTDFWLTFGRNAAAANTLESEQSLQIRIVGSEQATTGSIYFTHLDTAISFSIAAGQVYTYNLSEEEKLAACNETAGVNNLSIHITSSISVTVYALNQRFRSTDATNILPATVLGTDYYQMSYTASYSDAYAVVATQNNTQIYHDKGLINTLNAGQVYYQTSRDMTGDYITADKPVAFFAMSQGAQIPDGTSYIDILFQQLAPVSTWGKNFFVPVSWRGRDFVRILASQNSTNITQTGGKIRNVSGGQTTLANLNAGQWVELEISLDSNGCYIQADKPIGVCAYLSSTRYNPPMDTVSDPAQAWLPSIEQKINTALIAPFIPTTVTNLNQHYALIITSTATKKNITVKIGNEAEQALSGGKWYDNTAAGMSFYSMPLTNDTAAYLFTNRAGGLLIMGYGMGVAESYYYLSFSAMRSLDAAFYVNNIHYQDLSSENTCTQPAQFHAKLEGDISKKEGHLKWYINDIEEVTARDKLSWSKTLAPDTYNIKIVVLMEDNIMTKTIEGTLTVDKPTFTIIDAVTTPEICDRENGTISFTINSKDSTIVKYIWEGLLDTTPALSNLKAGTYRVLISDAFCVIEKTIIVEHIDGPVADFEFADSIILNAYPYISLKSVSLQIRNKI